MNNKKGIRIVIALVLGIIISIAGVAYPGADVEARGKPQPASELVNFNLVGDELHFQLHLVNLNQAFSYQVTFERSGWDNVTDPDVSPLGRVSRDYVSPEIIRDISYGYPGTVQGHYNVQVELFNRKGTSLGVTNATYECKFTVTFNETNDLSGVSIQLYSDPDRTIPKGDALITNEFGETQPIDLEDDYLYWYTATKTGYVDFMDVISVNGHNLTVNFHMPLFYAVTFNVTNNVGDNLSDVYIDIRKCNGSSWDYIDSVTTNTTGQATIDLLEGDEYYYYAMREGYDYLEGYFTVSGAPLTVSFTMIPFCTVTFNETNGLSGVYIEIYNDEEYVGDVATNATGQAIIDLPNDTYYYWADQSGYDEYEGDFTVSDSDITESFTMSLATAYTVTFNETNGLLDVAITIYDWDWNLIDVIYTNTTGQATIDLLEYDYYYYADKSGYAEVEGYFTVSGYGLTVSFTMIPAYTVTFNETNDLEGVNIEVYSDPDRIEWEGSLTTNATGQATIGLPDGTHYYTATLFLYADLFGNFTVSGAGVPVDFEMVPLTGVIFAEDFTGVDAWILPAGWTTDDSNGFVHYSDGAGGVAPELYLKYGPDSMASYDYRVSTPAINATAVNSTLNLCFKHYLHLYDYDLPYTYAVEVSTDGGTTWTATSFVDSPTETIGPTTVNINLSAYVGQTINISWRLYGYTWHSDGWYIDDIIVTGS